MRQIPGRNKLHWEKDPARSSLLHPPSAKLALAEGPALQPESPLIAEWPYSTGKRHAIWLCLDCVKECLKVTQLSSRKTTTFVLSVYKLPISCANLVPNRF